MAHPDPNSKLSNLLLVAASRGMDQDVRRLLNQDAPFGRDWLGRSALHLAAAGGHNEVIRILVAAGCDVNRRDQVSCTALHRAVVGDSSSSTVKALLAGGCKVDLQDEHGSTALHEAAWSGNYRVVRLLIKARCNVNVRNQSGFTALHLAAQNGHVKAVQELINGAADIQALNDYGDTPLHVATRYGHLEIARRLVNAGCSLDTFNRDRLAPIHIASQMGMLQIAELLIDSGCDLTVQTKDGLTAATLASRSRNRESARLLSRAMQASSFKVPPTPYGAAYTQRNENDVRGRTRQRHHSDESDTCHVAAATKGRKSSSRRHRSGSVERDGIVRVDYPAAPYYESDDSQPVGSRRYQIQPKRQWIRHRDTESQGRDSTTSASSAGASSTGASSTGRSGGGHRSASSERSRDLNGIRTNAKQLQHGTRSSAPIPYKHPPPYDTQYSSSPQPHRRHSADMPPQQLQNRFAAPGTDKPASIRVHHPFKGSNRPKNPFKKPPNLFFVSFEDPEPVEDACRLSDIGGRPYVPPARNLTRQTVLGKRIEEEPVALSPPQQNGHRKDSASSSASILDENQERNASEGEKEEKEDNRATSPYIRLAETPTSACNSPLPANRSIFSPKPGCLKQNGITTAASASTKRVAFDIPATADESEDQKEGSFEERKTGDGAQATETMLTEEGSDKSAPDDEHGAKMAALRSRHSSLPESQQHAIATGDGKGKNKGKMSTFKAFKKFVMSRHSKSALKKRMSEAAVLSLDKSGAGLGGSVVQSSTSLLQRSNSVRLPGQQPQPQPQPQQQQQQQQQQQRPVNPAEGVTESPPSGIQRGGRHNSEVLSSARSSGLFRVLRGGNGKTVAAPPLRMSSSSSLNDLTDLSASEKALLSPLPPPSSTSSSEDAAEQSKRESLVSGEDGADSVESPCEADKDYQVDALIAVEKARVERRCELKTAVEVATIEQKYQTKLMEIERECEARAAAKEVELQARIRHLEEKLVATKW